MNYYTKQSETKIKTCRDSLQRLFREVLKHIDHTIICGYRDMKEQNEAFKKGYSQVMFPNGKHNKIPSDAVDVMPSPIPEKWGKVSTYLIPVEWNIREQIEQEIAERCRIFYFAGFTMGTAKQMKIDVGWGGHWKNFEDLPHWYTVDEVKK